MKIPKLKNQKIDLKFSITLSRLFFLLLAVGLLVLIILSPRIAQVNARDLDVEVGQPYIMSNPPFYEDTDVTVEGIAFGSDEIDYVEFEYKIASGSWHYIMGDHLGGGYYRGIIPCTYFIAGETVHFKMVAYGSPYGETINKESMENSFDVVERDAPPPPDTISPTLSNPSHSPEAPQQWQYVAFSVTATDNEEVASVTIHLRIGTDNFYPYSCQILSDDVWTFEKQMIEGQTTAFYYFEATDTNSNEAIKTTTKTFYITEIEETTDTTDPTLSNPSHSPEAPQHLQPVAFSVTAIDNEEVASVTLYRKIGLLGSYTSRACQSASVNVWIFNEMFEGGKTIYYYFEATDTSNNKAESDTNHFAVEEETTETTDPIETTDPTDPTTPTLPGDPVIEQITLRNAQAGLISTGAIIIAFGLLMYVRRKRK